MPRQNQKYRLKNDDSEGNRKIKYHKEGKRQGRNGWLLRIGYD
jgi:hypothetical protein